MTSVVWLSAALVAALLGGPTLTGEAGIRLASLDGSLRDPLARDGQTRAVALVFLSVDCPISNRYAPEISRLRDRFSPAGLEVRLVYPNHYDSPRAIRAHLSAYGHRGLVLRDPDHRLVERVGVTVTPEAVVLDATGHVAYRGRIDDRFVSLVVQRPRPTRHDLEDAIVATLAGKTVTPASTPAVGCYVADFRR